MNERDSAGRCGGRNTIKTGSADAQELDNLRLHARLHRSTVNAMPAEIMALLPGDKEKKKQGMSTAKTGLSTIGCGHSKWQFKRRRNP
jgi:hypothetical protein